ncbi:PAS domain-containing protein [Luteimonas cucumeris]|uniref:histidine kinase n=1 Tax=Luteimonas cucumeris TaxID=985012 RepID=A0A562LAI5_9GAMM|nr:CHASE3 domain-containing protein [Luteimonas cucumeris]TWI04576.1 PAS domain-containing protein [Luteimonas cucumeris]
MPRIAFNIHNLGFGLALLVVVLLGWQARRTQDALLEANTAVTHSLEVITVVQGTLSALQDVETGMRGFVITGDDRFLEPYRGGQLELASERQHLHRLLADKPDHAQWLSTTELAIDQRLQLARQNVDARRNGGLASAAERVATAGGKEAMDRVRALLATLEAEERTRLSERHTEVASQVRQFRQFTTWGGLFALIVLIGALLSVDRNLMQRIKAARRAQAGEARQTAMLQAVPDLLWQIEGEGSPRLLSNAPGAVLPEAVLDQVRQALPGIRPGSDVHTLLVHDDGREYEARLVAMEEGYLLIVRDITEAARHRRQLRDQHGFLRAIVDTDESLIFVRNTSGHFTLCNVAFGSLLELHPMLVENHLPSDIAGHETILPLLHGDDALLQGEDEWRADRTRLVDARGLERWLQVLKRPLVLSDGQRQVLTVAVDVSAQQRMERMKDEFISTISHELRTPLTSIRGALGLVAGGMAGEIAETARPLIDIAHKNTERLVRLINDILDIEKLQWGGLSLQLHRLPLRSLVSQSIEQNLTYAREFDVSLELLPGEDGVAEVDVDRFAQVMANLLSNAIKHSRAGGTVEVGISRQDGGLEIFVQDHGEGIPERFRPQVFERFAQADGSNVRRRGGTGLGLAITRSLVEKMNGRIGFDSVTGEGTRFHVWLPEAMRVADTRPPDANAENESMPCVVLLQDDAVLARELGDMLAENGYRTCVATDLSQVRGLLERPYVHGLAIDLGSAGTAAPELLRELRSQPRYRFLPVLLLGVRPASDGVEGLRGGVVGIVDWLDKPLDPEQVAEAVRSCVRGIGPDERFELLHVEDDADVREVLRTLLDGQPLNLHAAASLTEARNHLAQRRHHLVILDLMLPDGNGSELLPELANARPPTPVIIFSAHETGVAEGRAVLRRLVKSRSHAGDLASLIMENLRHWPASGAQTREEG